MEPIFALVFLVGIAVGVLDALAGGGGLISIPFLIFMGLPAPVAIATDRLGTFGWSFGAITKFWHARKVNWKYVLPFSVLSIAGAYLGSGFLLAINGVLLSKLVAAMLLVLLPFIFWKSPKARQSSPTRKVVGYTLYLLFMFLGGFLGVVPGVTYILVFFFGMSIIETNATTVIPWFLLSVVSLTIFIQKGLVNYPYGITLAVSMLIGGYLGAHLAIKKGENWVKAVFAIVVVTSAIKLLFF